MSESREKELSCVEPEVGEDVLDLLSPALDLERRRLLEAHVAICDHCRLTLDVERRLGRIVREGGTGRPRRPGRLPWLGASAGVALAASLALMLLLPPRAIGPSMSVRGDDEAGFRRPVEGEVVGSGDIRMTWDPVPGAERYGVRVVGAESGAVWSGESREAEILIPAAADLPEGGAYRALLSTVPADLLPPGRVSVSFVTGGAGDVAAHRLRRAPSAASVLGLLGLGLGAAFVFIRRT